MNKFKENIACHGGLCKRSCVMVRPISDVNISTLGLHKTNSLMKDTISKISSGSRIPFAAADASGLAVSEKFRGQIRGFTRASANIQDGLSLLNTAEGGLSNISDDLLRLRELTIQAGNGALNDDDRQALEQEARAILESIDDTAGRTEFNNKSLLDGSTTANVSSAQSDITSFIRGPITESGSFSGSLSSYLDSDGDRTIEVTLSGNGSSTSVQLDENYRANNILNGLDLQFDEVSSAQVEGREVATEDVIAISTPAQLTLTDQNGDAATINFSAGNNTLTNMVEQLNNDLQTSNVDVTAVIEDGNIQLQGNNAGESFDISGTSAELTRVLGLTDGSVTAVPDEQAIFDGQTQENSVSQGIEFQSQISFEVSDATRAATQVNIGGAGVVLTESEIEAAINQQLSADDQNILATIDNGVLSLESKEIGDTSSISVTDVSTGADNLSSVLGVSDQSVRGSGSSNFTLNVSVQNLNFQTGSNQAQSSSFSFGDFSSDSLNLTNFSLTDSDSRDNFLSRIDNAIDRTSQSRSAIGAQSNRFQSQYNSAQTSIQNQTATESLIRDADLAQQAINLSREQSLLNTALFVQAQTMDLNRNFLGSLIE